MKHPLKFVKTTGNLMDALGISEADAELIEAVVNKAADEKWNLIRLLQTVGEMDLSDEIWANFLYTYGYWDGRFNK